MTFFNKSLYQCTVTYLNKMLNKTCGKLINFNPDVIDLFWIVLNWLKRKLTVILISKLVFMCYKRIHDTIDVHRVFKICKNKNIFHIWELCYIVTF